MKFDLELLQTNFLDNAYQRAVSDFLENYSQVFANFFYVISLNNLKNVSEMFIYERYAAVFDMYGKKINVRVEGLYEWFTVFCKECLNVEEEIEYIYIPILNTCRGCGVGTRPIRYRVENDTVILMASNGTKPVTVPNLAKFLQFKYDLSKIFIINLDQEEKEYICSLHRE